jgi:penicillin-binding protein 1A
MRLRNALAFSRNLVAARVILDVGPQAVADHAHRIGLQSRLDPVPSLGLGTSEVTPLEHTNAFATWDAAGRYAPPIVISRIVGPDGREVPLPARAAPRDAVTPDEAWLVTSLLTSVVQTRGATGQRALELHRPVAGKTGTSNDVRDAWFVGYTPDLVCGVWVGFDDRQPLGRGEEGARTALPVWVQFMRRYLSIAHPPPIDFPRPPGSGITTARIDPAMGLLARPDQTDALDEFFLAGTEPREIAVPVGDAGTNWFTATLTGGDGGIAIEAPEAPADAGSASEPPLTLPTTPDAGAVAPTAVSPAAPTIPTPPNATPPPNPDPGAVAPPSPTAPPSANNAAPAGTQPGTTP